MSPSGRIFGGVLIGIALLWIFQMAGALPFRNRTVNQLAANPPQDRPPVEDPNAPRTGVANFGTNSPSQSARVEDFSANPETTPDRTTPSSGTAPNGTASTNPNRSTAQPRTTSPVVPGLW